MAISTNLLVRKESKRKQENERSVYVISQKSKYKRINIIKSLLIARALKGSFRFIYKVFKASLGIVNKTEGVNMGNEERIIANQSKACIVFDPSVKELILDAFDKTVDEEGFIVEKSNPKQRVLTFEGKELKLANFGGIERGSEIFIENNLISLMNLIKKG